MEHFDVVIMGAGLGGLLCAVILAKEGRKVALIEQNKQIGGCLQTFAFKKKVFDSCVHYVGAMDPGQTQHRIFSYAGIMPHLQIERLNTNGFDQIYFSDSDGPYPIAQGAENFVTQLLPYFAKEAGALRHYMELMAKTAASFPLYQLRNGSEDEKDWIRHKGLTEVLDTITPNRLLQSVLTGNNLLYAGQHDKTPFYVHALAVQSYLDSSYRFSGGSSQVAKQLLIRFRAMGGSLFTKEKIGELHCHGGRIGYAKTVSGRKFFGRQFIANVHPAMLMRWLPATGALKPAFRNRMLQAENSISAFMVNIVFKPRTVRYANHNIYWHSSRDSFAGIKYRANEWPGQYALYFSRDPANPGYAETAAVLTYMHADEVAEWAHTHNRSAAPSEREADYTAFKNQKATRLLDQIATRFPEMICHIDAIKTATPLSFRDYMGTTDGSMYGIVKNVQQPAAATVPVRTQIDNLFLTGQNVNLHGVLGVSITSIATCGAMIGLDHLLHKINHH